MRNSGRLWAMLWAPAALIASAAPAEDAAPVAALPPAVDFLAAGNEPAWPEEMVIAPSTGWDPLGDTAAEFSRTSWLLKALNPPPPYGSPLVGTSWCNRPFHAGWMVGVVFGDDLVNDQLGLGEDLIGGYRFGEDMSPYWGWEGRFAFANPAVETGDVPPQLGSADVWFGDGNVMLYPWGDSQWRPCLSAGAGAAGFRFTDEDGRRYRETLFQIPLGVGMKYLYRPWLAMRVDITHNVAFDDGELDTMDNVSATFGAEIHFGGRRRSYFPW
ncbi:MAG: hypothetical protein KY475_26615 [Planctomycetes bacterium]|nr:hypothetical protein [Planctomycetota bacterium]